MATYTMLEVKDGYTVVKTRKFLGMEFKRYINFHSYLKGDYNFLLFSHDSDWFTHRNISIKAVAEQALKFCQLMKP